MNDCTPSAPSFPLCYWSFPRRGLPSGYAKAYFPLGLLCSLRRVVKLADECRPSVLEDGVDSGVRRRVTLPGRLGAPTWLSCNRPGSRPTTSHMLGQPTSPTCTCVCVSVCVAIFCPASTPAPWHVQRSRGAPPPRTTFIAFRSSRNKRKAKHGMEHCSIPPILHPGLCAAGACRPPQSG